MAEPRLDQQRAALADKLAALKIPPEVADMVRTAEGAVARINSEAAELQAKIDDIDRQTGLRELDRRAAAETAHQEKLADQREKLVGEVNTYLEAIGSAEDAERALAASVHRAFESNARLAAIARDLAPDGKAPGALSAMDLERALALRIASAMTMIPKRAHRLGDLAWPSAARSFYPPEASWTEAEAKRLTNNVIQPLLAEGKN